MGEKNWRALGASNESKMSKIQKKTLTFDCQFVVAGVDEVPNAEENLGQMPRRSAVVDDTATTIFILEPVSSDLLKQ